jgi:hypothetical protein
MVTEMSQAQIPFDWKEAQVIDFKVMNEDWQTYELSDKSQLKVKMILTQVWRAKTQVNPMTGEPLYMWNTINALALLSFPETLRGQSTTGQITPQMIAQNIEHTVDFEMLGKQNEWNVYNLTDGSVLRLRLNITGVSRTKLRGLAGEPIYNVATGVPNYRLTVAENLIRMPSGQTSSKSQGQLYG